MGKKAIIFAAIILLVLFAVSCTKPAGKVTLTVWAGDDPASDNPQAAYVRALVPAFEKANPDIKLEWTAFGFAGSPLNDKLKIVMASEGTDQLPDIFQSWGGNLMGQFAEAGKLLDLTTELSTIPCSDAAKNAMSYKGKIYGVAPFFAIAGLFINEGKFKELNLSVPTTIEEMEKCAEVLKANKIQPFACGAKDLWPLLHTYMYLVNRIGGDVFDQSIARTVSFDSDPFVQAGLKIQEWAKKGYYGEKPLSEGYDVAQLAMQTGKAGMQLSGSWLCGLYANKEQSDQTFSFHTFPVIPGGKGLASDLMGMTDVGFAVTAAAEKKKDAVVRFFKFLMSVEAISAETGRVSSVSGVKAPTYLTGQASDVFATAKTVQFWWDQNLPPAVTTPVNTTIQSFMLPETNVKDSLGKFEALLVENLGAIK